MTRIAEPPGSRLRDGFTLAVLLALAAGLLDLVAVAIKVFAIGHWLDFGLQIVWMAPLSYLLIFTVLMLGWFAAGYVAAPLGRFPLLVFVLTVVAVSGPLFALHPTIHKAASGVLAIGVAVRLTVLARERRARLLTGARRGGWLLGTVVVALTAVVNVRAARPPARRAGRPAPAGAPNVLLLIIDTARSLSLSAWGYHRPTSPALEHLAARGVRFQNAFSPAPWTLPSHASFFTGRPAHELSADWWSPLDDRYPVLAERFAANGYATVGVVANTMMAVPATGLARGFETYDYTHVSLDQIIGGSRFAWFVSESRPLRRLVNQWQSIGRRSGSRINAEFLDWIDRRDGRPFFAFLNYFDPHTPYAPAEPFRSRFAYPDDRGLVERVRNYGQPLTQAFFQVPDTMRVRGLYEAGVAQADDAVGRLLAELDRRGVLDSTIVLLVSDHGEEFHEHGEWEHSGSLYQTALHVPLIVAGPGVPAGRVVAQAVETRRLAATLLDLARIPDSLPGASLAEYWTGDGTVPGDTALSSRTPSPGKAVRGDTTHAWSLVAGDLHYLNRLDRSEYLYDYVRDPFEMVNLVDRPEHADAVAAFRARLAAIIAAAGAR